MGSNNHCSGNMIWKAFNCLLCGKGTQRGRTRSHKARTDASMNASENGVQRVVIFNPENTAFSTTVEQATKTPWEHHQNVPQRSTEPVVSPSVHAFTAGILPPSSASETKEVMEFRSADSAPSTGIHAGYWDDHRYDVDGFRHGSQVSRNVYGSPDSGIFRWSPEREAEVHRRDYYCADFPTPVRERIQNQNRDSNNIATMFSDENPNACYIV